MEGHEDTARPQQPDSGFAEGIEHAPDTPADDQEPDFARGLRDEPDPERDVHPRFSRGEEDLPPSPEKEAEGSFADGHDEATRRD